MYQVIARKYRPQSFQELVGQEHVRTTLGNAIGQNRIAHGYIFSGQRGTGKTTVARIMARCLNCEKGPTIEPCLQCSACKEIAAGNCIDVIEIDAASNRGINEMRELRENVRFRPARDRFKVFIIDEAHQITTEAFNALLKTLEEPPEWVVFIMCTTESHKIPTTIASRCQQFSFRSVEFGELVARMNWICGEEKITAEPEALGVIAQVGEGSVRDSLSALDQAIACCGSNLKAAEVRELLGVFSLDSMGEVTRCLEAQNSRGMLELVQELERNGRHLQHFCRELARYFRNLLVLKVLSAPTRLVPASDAEQAKMAGVSGRFSEEDLTRYLQITLDLYRELQYSLQPRLHLELGLLRLIHAGRLKSIEDLLSGLPAAPPEPARASSVRQAPPTAPLRMETPVPAPSPAPQQQEAAWPSGGGSDARTRLLQHLRESEKTMLADAVECSQVTATPAEWNFAGPMAYKLSINSGDMKAAVQQVAGRPVRIVFIPSETAAAGSPVSAGGGGKGAGDDEVTRRAMDNPEVQRFREMFPGSQVRTVRNLKE